LALKVVSGRSALRPDRGAWNVESHAPDAPETQVTVELRPNGKLTDLTLIHKRFRNESLRDRHKTD
jgi:hypothetical protein